MNCYFCNHKILYFISDYLGINQCPSCQTYYIKVNDLENFISMYCLTKLNIDSKYASKIIKELLEILNQSNSSTLIKCNNKNCKTNCSGFYQYQIGSFQYSLCTVTNYYIFKKENLINYINKLLRKNKLKYFFYKITFRGDKF